MTNRIQGTDGIRGRVQRASEFPDLNPLEVLQKHDVLTEQFFELYTYTYCEILLDQGWAKVGDSVVIGWDSRDSSGVFNRAAVMGIRKAGLTACVVGILPTPVIALYMQMNGAKCSFVLTASHNPADQNGIKIFLGESGLKLFPEDDVQLTERLFKLAKLDLSLIPIIGSEGDHANLATQCFVDFHSQNINHWCEQVKFSNIHLIVDSANGAFSKIIRLVLNKFSWAKIYYCNDDFQKPINALSGVADLEGRHFIDALQVDEAHGEFHHYAAILQLFQEGRKLQTELQTSQKICCAFVFDGDGDRFYRLDYDPFLDRVLIMSGDQISVLQAQYLLKNYSWPHGEPWYINTVESDLESLRTAQHIGLQYHQTAVGDKWILWEAVKRNYQAFERLAVAFRNSHDFRDQVHKIHDMILNMEKTSCLNALKLTQSFQHLVKLFYREGGTTDQMRQLQQDLSIIGENGFVIGSEESGHSITQGVLQTLHGRLPVFIGNGFKSALNTIAAIQYLRPENNKVYYEWISQPYKSGFQKSFAVYYVDKTMLEPKHPFRHVIKDQLQQSLRELWPAHEILIEEFPRPEEPPLLFFEIKSLGDLIATVFVRNSGTEDKLSLYLRGRKQDEKLLLNFAQSFFPFLLQRLKDSKKEYAKAEAAVIRQIVAGQTQENQFDLSAFPQVIKARLLKEMSAKQKIIVKTAIGWSLTAWGEQLHFFSERSEKK